MRILRAPHRTAVPWKNGGGVTREVCTMPEGAGFDFAWRLSVAEVGASGPFSRFPGIDRHLAVLKGRMRLAVGGKWSPAILPQSPPMSFDGEADTFAEVLESVIDVNLMTRRGVYNGMLEWIKTDRQITLLDPNAETILLAVDPIKVQGAKLDPFDAIWCEPGRLSQVQPHDDFAWVIAARIRRSDTNNTKSGRALRLGE